jgi:hypothetical protein
VFIYKRIKPLLNGWFPKNIGILSYCGG